MHAGVPPAPPVIEASVAVTLATVTVPGFVFVNVPLSACGVEAGVSAETTDVWLTVIPVPAPVAAVPLPVPACVQYAYAPAAASRKATPMTALVLRLKSET